jgi:hypothetical protein
MNVESPRDAVSALGPEGRTLVESVPHWHRHSAPRPRVDSLAVLAAWSLVGFGLWAIALMAGAALYLWLETPAIEVLP